MLKLKFSLRMEFNWFLEKIRQQCPGINTNKLAAVEYSITGSWDKPNIKVIEAFKPLLN